MKKVLYLALVFCASLVLFSIPVLAYSPFDAACSNAVNQGGSTVCNAKGNTSNPITGKSGVIVEVANAIALVTGIAAVLIIIVSGFKFITSSGDPAKVNSARETILYAVIGLLVVAIARSIVVFIINRI